MTFFLVNIFQISFWKLMTHKKKIAFIIFLNVFLFIWIKYVKMFNRVLFWNLRFRTCFFLKIFKSKWKNKIDEWMKIQKKYVPLNIYCRYALFYFRKDYLIGNWYMFNSRLLSIKKLLSFEIKRKRFAQKSHVQL